MSDQAAPARRRVRWVEQESVCSKDFDGSVKVTRDPVPGFTIVKQDDHALLIIPTSALLSIQVVDEERAVADPLDGLPSAAGAAQAILAAFGNVAVLWGKVSEAGTYNTPAAAEAARILLRELGYEVPAVYRGGRHMESRIASAMGRSAAAHALGLSERSVEDGGVWPPPDAPVAKMSQPPQH